MQHTPVSDQFAQDAWYGTHPEYTASTPVYTEEINHGLRPQSPGSYNTLLSPGAAKERKRAHMQMSWWLPETLPQVGGILCLLGRLTSDNFIGDVLQRLTELHTGIILLLWYFNGKPPPNWQIGITLNTALAFLTSLTKVAFLVPAVEGLGQLKWM